MTVEQFYTECGCKSALKVLSARTGKVFTPYYKQEKHAESVGKKELLAVWAELQVANSGFGNYCRPIMCCYAGDGGAKDIDSECTIHAVEVVRCKNCQYYELLGDAILTDAVRGICTYRPMAYGVKDNDFCSYGKRKGDVESDGMDQRER